MNDLSFRNIWIGAGIAMLIGAVGALLFHDAGQGPMSIVALSSMVSAVVVLHVLDDRELRRNKEDD